VVLVGAAAGIFAWSRRNPVTADNVNDVPPVDEQQARTPGGIAAEVSS
jgi:hypothetical protein